MNENVKSAAGGKSIAKKQSWGAMIAHDFSVNKSLYLLVLPVMAFYLIFHYLPMYGAIISFENFKPQLGITGSAWVGFKHFKDFLSGNYFSSLLFNTLRISFSSLVFSFPAPIILALLINELKSQKFAKIVQNITYMPYFISMVVICGLITNFTLDTGVVNYIMGFFGFKPKSLLNYPQYFVPIYVISDIWQGVGWNSIIYLAALSAVDPSLYESAVLDGANRLLLRPFARRIECCRADCGHANSVTLTGCICRETVFRTTPFGREITDMLIAVNRDYKKADYIPCIAWGGAAHAAKELCIGARVRIEGRLQSRQYTKNENGIMLEKTAYELSIARLERR